MIEVTRASDGYGFNLSRLDDNHIFRAIEPGGAADRAGIRVGDIILQF